MSGSNSTHARQSHLSFADEDLDNLVVLSEQKSQAEPAKDINHKIDALSKEIAQFSGAFSLSREIVGQAIDDLKQQGAKAQSEFERVSQGRDQQIDTLQKGVLALSRKQIKTDRAVESIKAQAQADKQSVQQALGQHDDCFTAVQADLARCDEEFIQTQAAMQGQAQRLSELNKHLQALEALEQELQARLDQQSLDQQAADAELAQTIQANKLLIEGLQALHRQQQDELAATNQRHFALCVQVDELSHDLYELETQTLAYQQSNDQRFWRSSALWSFALLVCFGLFAAGSYVANNAWSDTQNSFVAVNESYNDQQGRIIDIDRNMADVNQQIAASAAATEQLDSQLDDLRYVIQGPGVNGVGASEAKLPVLSKEEVVALSPQAYSLQMLTVNRLQDVVNYINQREAALSGKTLFYTQSNKNGVIRYSLFVGVIDSYSQAQTVLNNLPLRLSSNAPWIRKIGNIQRAMAK